MNAFIIRGQLLLQQHRHADAEREFRQAIAADPNLAVAHGLLAVALSEQGKLDPALREAQAGIALAPQQPFQHYALAAILTDAERWAEARRAIEEAIRLDPTDPDYHKVLSATYLGQAQWQKALDAAQTGLALDPEHGGCTNLRAIALVKMGRTDEAAATIDATLARDPENATSHATQGWALLHANKIDEAMRHFQEALRLNPNLEWAQNGILEALKARNPIYRVMLQYFLWMSRLSPRARWGVMLGGYFGVRALILLQKNYPALLPIVAPIAILYFIFVILTWIAEPLFDLALRLHPLGRLALPRERIIASNWLGLCMLSALVGLVAFLTLPTSLIRTGLGLFGLQSALMMIPVAAVHRAGTGRARTFRLIYATGLAALMLLGLLSSLSGHDASAWYGLFVIGWVSFTLLANLIS